MMREFHRSTRIDSVVCGTNLSLLHGSSIDIAIASSTKSRRSPFNAIRRYNLKGTSLKSFWVPPNWMPKPSVQFRMRLVQVCSVGRCIIMGNSHVTVDTQGGSRVVRGSVAKSMQVEEEDIVCLGLFKYYNRKEPQVYFSRRPIVGAAMLSLVVELHNFAILDGKRLTPTARSRRNTAGSSLIQFRYQGKAFAGEVRQLLRHVQPGVPTSANVILAYVSWMKRSNLTPLDGGRFPWDNQFVLFF